MNFVSVFMLRGKEGKGMRSEIVDGIFIEATSLCE